MINSEELGWNDTHIAYLGRPVVGVIGIKYGEKQEKKNVYSKGKKPRRRARGRVEYVEGHLKILGSELWSLLQSHGRGKSILSIEPFTVVHASSPEVGGNVVTNTLQYVEFTGVDVEINEGDTHIEHTLPIIYGDINWNI